MIKKVVYTKKSPNPVGPYSQAIQINNFLYISGQIAIDPRTSKIVSGGIKEQVIQTLENIKYILESVNLTLFDIIKVMIFLKDFNDFKIMNEIYQNYFQSDFPARTTVQSSLIPGALIEIDAIAYKP